MTGANDAHCLDPAALSHPTGATNPGRVDDTELSPVPPDDVVDRVPCRARCRADQHAILTQEPVHQRRLADVWATHDGDTGFRRALRLLRHRRRRRRRRQPCHHLVEQVSDALTMLGGDLDDRLEAEPAKLRDPLVGPMVVHLVDRQHDRDTSDAELSSHLVVGRNRTLAPVHHEHHQVDRLDCPPPAIGDRLPHRVLTGPPRRPRCQPA